MGRILVSAVFGWDPIFVTFRTGEHIGETLLLGKGDGDSVRKTSGESPWVNKSQEAGTPTCYNVKNYILEHNFRTLKTCLLHFCHQPELFRKKEGCDIVIPFLFLSLFWLITALRYHFHYDPSPSTSDHQHQDEVPWYPGGATFFFFSGPPQKGIGPSPCRPHTFCASSTLCGWWSNYPPWNQHVCPWKLLEVGRQSLTWIDKKLIFSGAKTGSYF